jgi:hypothetical protein
MSDSYTTLWSRDRVEAARTHAPADFRFDLLFGGPHQSLPSLIRAGVRAGDWIYPIHVRDFALHVLGRMRATRVLTLAEFASENPHRADGVGRPGFDAVVAELDGRTPAPRRPEVTYLAPTCTEDAVVGDAGTPLWFDLTVPGEVVARLRYRSRRGERAVKHVVEGRVKSHVSFDGVYRLAPESADVLAEIVGRRLASGS